MTLVVRPASMALGMLILATTAVHGQAGTRSEEVLTNASVAQLVQSKLARKLIVAKIRDSRNSFDVSAVGLVALRAQDVPEEILGVMLESAAEAAARDALSNQGVVQMLDAKLSRDLVITKIRGATPNFDLTTSGLVSLQQRKVPRQVIEAMMLAGNSSSSSPPVRRVIRRRAATTTC
ncbi:MAG: hypothetical protein KF785_05770 [Gemmatimonadales bacterium]|nr:hypothetical protein [Gemmatimonadales bacterium]